MQMNGHSMGNSTFLKNGTVNGNGLRRYGHNSSNISYSETEKSDFEIQEVLLMPSMKLDTPITNIIEEPRPPVKATETPKTKFVLQQLG